MVVNSSNLCPLTAIIHIINVGSVRSKRQASGVFGVVPLIGNCSIRFTKEEAVTVALHTLDEALVIAVEITSSKVREGSLSIMGAGIIPCIMTPSGRQA